MTNIDTIREALEMAVKLAARPLARDKYNEALAALSTIDPDAKLKAYNRGYKACQTGINMGAEDYLKPSSEDVIGMAQRIESRFHQGHYAEDYNAIAAIITAHDDAIRRECAEKISNSKRSYYDDDDGTSEPILVICVCDAVAAILGKEAEK